MNKKLVIAALLAAVIAEGEEGAEAGAGEAGAEEAGAGEAEAGAEGEAAEGEGEAAAEGEGEAAAGEGEAAEGEGEAAGEGAGEGEAAEEEEPADPNAGKLPEEIRDAWKDAVTDAVLCDQGDSALWLDAQDSFKDLKEKHDKAVEDK
jgi:hypothetical protein